MGFVIKVFEGVLFGGLILLLFFWLLTGGYLAWARNGLVARAENVRLTPATLNVVLVDEKTQLVFKGQNPQIVTAKGYYAFELSDRLYYWKYKGFGLGSVVKPVDVSLVCSEVASSEEHGGYVDPLAHVGVQISDVSVLCGRVGGSGGRLGREIDRGSPLYYLGCKKDSGVVISSIWSLGCK